ncbi:hypothetical protein LEN26_002752 [Aphanomyces euteiches]|nr:hypothetical protein AeMF1_006356 [Aphanomyces euteiches]KAH9158745.1 hypothetical protein LEN26_002752 [Aphanomyces euteiches]KAH9181910.1 hypothetical protein AeNC1_016113 [Aphanomyces euteiches]
MSTPPDAPIVVVSDETVSRLPLNEKRENLRARIRSIRIRSIPRRKVLVSTTLQPSKATAPDDMESGDLHGAQDQDSQARRSEETATASTDAQPTRPKATPL